MVPALTLLRDSFDSHFARFILVAPSLPADSTAEILEPLGNDDGFDPRPSLSKNTDKRTYWLGGGRWRWKHDVARALDDADVVHTACDNLYLPLSLDAILMARARDLPHTFFVDTDSIVQNRNLIDAGLMRNGLDRAIYAWTYERVLRRIAARADVSFLKGRTLFERYGRYARNPKLFHDTSYRSDEVVGGDVIAQRLATRQHGALRLVYCGRLVARKGCDHSIDIVAKARAGGADITLDLIGSGEERQALEAQAWSQGVGEAVRFLGERPYGPGLLQDLAAYDGLLFTPVTEDTPRMIFDGYAAGLPLLGYGIPYVRERAAEEQATVLLPFGETESAAACLMGLAVDPGRLSTLTIAALQAGRDNSTDRWYRRRADWTLEAFAQAQEADRHP